MLQLGGLPNVRRAFIASEGSWLQAAFGGWRRVFVLDLVLRSLHLVFTRPNRRLSHRTVCMSDASHEVPESGQIPYAIGQSSAIRIPIPGTGGLWVELKPRGYIPPGGSTSTLFFQDSIGRRQLRLDYGPNPRTNTIDYHWNQQRVYAQFRISDHTAAGRSGAGAYQAAKYFKYAGRMLFVAGAAIDIVSIVRASNPLRRASEVVVGWAGAWVGCKLAGAGGAAAGTAAAPGIGTAIGGVTAHHRRGSRVRCWGVLGRRRLRLG